MNAYQLSYLQHGTARVPSESPQVSVRAHIPPVRSAFRPPARKREAMRIFLVTVASLCLVSTPAFAAPAGDADSSARAGSSGGSTVYDFEDDNVDGETLSPTGANISSRGRTKHESMIKIRPHFIPELIKMANDI